MNASSSPDLAGTYADVLRGFGLTRSQLGEPHADEGPLTAETIRWDLNLEDADQAYELLRATLVRSDRGIEAPRRYWSQAPAFQLNDVLAAFGYEIAFEATGGGAFEAADGAFDVVLFEDGTERDRITFGYPEGPLGEDNYPALVHAVRTQLLPAEETLAFVLLAEPEDAWRFVLVDPSDLEALRSEYGHRVEVFGRSLLCEDRPADFFENSVVVDPGGLEEGDRAGFIGGLDSVVAASGIDDVFENIEREAATEPVAPTPEARGELDDDVRALITNAEDPAGVESPTVREVSGDRLDAVVDRFEADPTDVEDASARLRAVENANPETAGEPDAEADHIPSPSPKDPRGTGLSQQVAEALYSGEDDEEFVPGVDPDGAEEFDGVDPGSVDRAEPNDGSNRARTGPDRNEGIEPVNDHTKARSRTRGEPSMSVRERGRTDGDSTASTDDGPGDSSESAPDDGRPDSAPEVVAPFTKEDEKEGDDDRSRSRLGQLSETVRDLL